MYDSRPCIIIITLGDNLYKIPDVALLTAIYMIAMKQSSKIISQTGKFVFLMIHPQGKKNIMATTSREGSST